MLRPAAHGIAGGSPLFLALFLAACGAPSEDAAGTSSARDAGSRIDGDGTVPVSNDPESNDPDADPTSAPSAASTEPGAPASSTAPGATPSAPGPDPGVADPSTALLVPAVRLSRDELDQILEDVLLDDTTPARRSLAEDEYTPFDNAFERQTVSRALVDSLSYLAEDVAARALTNADARARIVPCAPAAPADAECFDQVVQRLGALFFRAPVSDEDVAAYRALLAYGEEAADFDVAVGLLLQSFLQDPEFLYRLERGATADASGVRALDGYEIATRLSFLLWGTGPDETLMQAAPNLTSSDARRAAAEGMLADPRAERQLFRFHSMWLGYRSLPDDDSLPARFRRETEALIARAVFDADANYLTLFDSPETFVDEALATHYGLPAPASGTGWVRYPDGSGRAGVLSHGSVLSSFSKFSDTSPTQRGIFVRTRLLCEAVPPPPAVVDVDQPPGDGEPGCKLDRYVAHAEQSGCVECHSLFDPIGFGLENYDMLGRYREHDDGNPDCLIDASGELPGYGEFRGPGELASLLVDNDLIEGCFARQFMSHALATSELAAPESALASELGRALAEGGGDVSAWLLDFVGGDRFARRPEETP